MTTRGPLPWTSGWVCSGHEGRARLRPSGRLCSASPVYDSVRQLPGDVRIGVHPARRVDADLRPEPRSIPVQALQASRMRERPMGAPLGRQEATRLGIGSRERAP